VQARAFPFAPIHALKWGVTYLKGASYGLAGLGLSSQAEYLPFRDRQSFFVLSGLCQWQLSVLFAIAWIGACQIAESFPVL
jgi:hypothetical protein